MSQFPTVDLSMLDIPRRVLELVPSDVAIKTHSIPVSLNGRTLVVAMTDPDNAFKLDYFRFATGLDIAPVHATEADIADALERHYDTAQPVLLDRVVADDHKKSFDLAEEFIDEDEFDEPNQPDPIVTLSRIILLDAVARNATHITGDARYEDDGISYAITITVDGEEQDFLSPPGQYADIICRRYQYMADILFEDATVGTLSVHDDEGEELTFRMTVVESTRTRVRWTLERL